MNVGYWIQRPLHTHLSLITLFGPSALMRDPTHMPIYVSLSLPARWIRSGMIEAKYAVYLGISQRACAPDLSRPLGRKVAHGSCTDAARDIDKPPQRAIGLLE